MNKQDKTTRKTWENIRVTVTINKSIVETLDRLRNENKINSPNNAKFVQNALITYTYLIEQKLKGNEINIHKNKKIVEFVPADILEVLG